jgi:hypothetical protein
MRIFLFAEMISRISGRWSTERRFSDPAIPDDALSALMSRVMVHISILIPLAFAAIIAGWLTGADLTQRLGFFSCVSRKTRFLRRPIAPTPTISADHMKMCQAPLTIIMARQRAVMAARR